MAKFTNDDLPTTMVDYFWTTNPKQYETVLLKKKVFSKGLNRSIGCYHVLVVMYLFMIASLILANLYPKLHLQTNTHVIEM
jgi:hypothetical protein